MKRPPPLVVACLVLGSIALGLAGARATGLWKRAPRHEAHDEHHEAELLARVPAGTTGGQGPDAAVPRKGRLPEFELVEADGSALNQRRLLGHPWVASFLFTRCDGPCPAIAQRLRVLQGALPSEAYLVSISVDPVRDTPEVLKAWGAALDRDPRRWLLATGEWKAVQQLVSRGFHVGPEDALLHTTSLALVDAQGELRGFYESRDEEAMGALVRDLSLLIAATGT